MMRFRSVSSGGFNAMANEHEVVVSEWLANLEKKAARGMSYLTSEMQFDICKGKGLG